MSSNGCQCKEEIRKLCLEAGAVAAGFAAISPLPDSQTDIYDRWLAQGRNASMDYMERYADIRRDPALLLEGAQTVISCAFAYRTAGMPHHPLFADYALGEDYHKVLRKALKPVAKTLEAMCPGSKTRICVDTAPIRERFWATRAGIGFIGLNNHLIVPDVGSAVFLAEILWTEKVEPDATLEHQSCDRCGACIKACPTHALDGQGGIDCRRCLSYLTIEHRGELPEGTTLPQRIYGCDICRDACPYNRKTYSLHPKTLPGFTPSDAVMSLTLPDIKTMSEDVFADIFARSAVKRAGIDGLKRNAAAAGTDTTK